MPTLAVTSDAKDEFYDMLDNCTCQYPSDKALVILGDFNSQDTKTRLPWPC